MGHQIPTLAELMKDLHQTGIEIEGAVMTPRLRQILKRQNAVLMDLLLIVGAMKNNREPI